jgi:peptidoglycan/xylan/chitin deacetylase (PgdA/CDA1 family)
MHGSDVRATPTIVLPDRLVVLMYHGLHRDPLEPHFDPRYSVLPIDFERQMRLLAMRRERAWLPGMAPAIAPPAAPEVMITFDDGFTSDAEIALPCLRAAGLRAAFFVTTDFVDRPGRVTRAQLLAIAAAGMSIGSHGATHRFLSTLPAEALREELRRSRSELEQWTGQPVTLLALPGGRGGVRERDAALAAGYTLVFGSEPGDNHAPPRSGVLQRVPVVRGTTLRGFADRLAWDGPDVRRLRWRHRLLQLPKAVIGDQRYDRLRTSLLR